MEGKADPPEQEEEEKRNEAVLPSAAMNETMTPGFMNSFNSQQQPINLFGFSGSNSYLSYHPSGRHSAPTVPHAGLAGYPGTAIAGYPGTPSMMAAAAAYNNNGFPALAGDSGNKRKSSAAAAKAKKKPRKVTTKKNKQGRGGGHDSKYSDEELKILLTACDKFLPIGKPAWTAVTEDYNSKRPEGRPERELNSLRNKFQKLVDTSPPTGDAEPSVTVSEAKRIDERIYIKSRAFVASEMDEDDNELVLSSDEDENTGNLKTTGLDDNDTVDEAKEKEKEKEKKKRQSTRSNRGKKLTETGELIEALLVSEKLQAKRERERDRRSNAREKRNMKLLFGMFGMALNTFAPASADQVDVEALTKVFSSSSSSEEESLSSVDTDDSPPTKRAKMDRKKKSKQKSRK